MAGAGNAATARPRSRGQGGQRQVPGGRGRRDSDGRWRRVLHHRRPHAPSRSPRQVCRNAAATIAVGACAFDGGLVRSNPNPTGALGVQEAVPGIKVINMAGCPHNPANTAAVLVHYLTFNDLPALDQYNRPLFAYGRVIHDQCERRAHLRRRPLRHRMGRRRRIARAGACTRWAARARRPPSTARSVQWNDHTSWPIRAGHGCIACASPRFWDHMSPFYERLPNVPGFGVEVSRGRTGPGTGRRRASPASLPTASSR